MSLSKVRVRGDLKAAKRGVVGATSGPSVFGTIPVPVTPGTFALFGPEAGGYLTGLSMADDGTAYVRADVGGAYRKAPGATSPWTQLITLPSVPTPRFDDFLVDAISCSPSQPQHVYAAVGQGYDGEGRVMRSTNSGTTWTVPGSKRFQIHGNGEYRYGREPLAVQHDKPEVVYYGTRREGLWRSLDGGATWAQMTTLPAAPASTDYNRNDVSVILIERGSATATVSGVTGVRQGLWAGVRGKGIYRSTNGGATWTLLHAIGATAWVRDAMLDSNGGLVAAVQSPTSLVRVTPAGAVTTLANPMGGESPGTIAVHPGDPMTLWTSADGARDGGLWRSGNGGTSWTALNVAVANGTDAVWPTQSDLDGYMSMGQIRYDPSDTSRLWFAEGMGAWTSTDLADTEVTWTFQSKGIQELVANAIVKPPGTGAVAVTWDRGVWKWGADGKATLPPTAQGGVFCSGWDVQARPDAPLVMAAVVSDHQSGDTNAAKRLSCITTDGGTTWTRLAGLAAGTTEAGLRFGTIAIATGSTDNLVWAPCYEDYGPDITGVPLRYSTDRGATWQTPTVSPALGVGERISDSKFNKQRKVVADPNVPGKFYALSFNNTNGNTWLLTSTNGGATWTRVQAGPSGAYAAQYSCHLTAVKVGSATRLYWTPGPRGNGVPATLAAAQADSRMSTDGGATWTVLPIKGGFDLAPGAPISPSTSPTLFCYGWAGTVRGLYYSTDLGATWALMVNEPLGWHQGVSALCGDPEVPGKVYAGMPGGSFFVGSV